MSDMHNGYQACLDAMARGLEPDPNLTVDVWSDRFMVIPKSTGSNEAGPYRTSRTPHAREVMLALLDALERKDRLLNSMREDFRLIGKDYLGPEELSSCCDLCIEAITKELT